MKTRNNCFTMVELWVIIAILVILFALLFPFLTSMRKNALEVECAAKLKEISQGYAFYNQDYENYAMPLEDCRNNNKKICKYLWAGFLCVDYGMTDATFACPAALPSLIRHTDGGMWTSASYWSQHWSDETEGTSYNLGYGAPWSCAYGLSTGFHNISPTGIRIPLKVTSLINGFDAGEVVKITECTEYVYLPEWLDETEERRVWIAGEKRHKGRNVTAFLDGHIGRIDDTPKWNTAERHALFNPEAEETTGDEVFSTVNE